MAFAAGCFSLAALFVLAYAVFHITPSEFTQLRDGSWALAPQGGVVVQLGQHWQAVASATHRLEAGEPLRPFDGLTPVRLMFREQRLVLAGRGEFPVGR